MALAVTAHWAFTVLFTVAGVFVKALETATVMFGVLVVPLNEIGR